MADYRRNTAEQNGGRIRNHTMQQNQQINRYENASQNYYVSRNYNMNQSGTQAYGYTYTSGNTVRKVDPVYAPPEKEPVRRRRKNQNVRPKKRADQGVMTGRYALFLGVISSLLLTTCFQYLSVRSEVTSKKSEITALQSAVSNLKMDNDATLGIVNQTVNMESVRQRAEELGMAFMEREQLKNYKAPTEDIMKQYNGIPSNGVVAQYDRAYE